MMLDVLTACALAIALEGAVYALFPRQMRDMLASVAKMSPQTIRVAGVVALAVGVVCLWAIRDPGAL